METGIRGKPHKAKGTVENHINWHYTHTSEWKRLAVPCGRAGSAANTHYDQDILTSAIVWKIIPRFPFSVRIVLLGGSFYSVKH